MSRIALPEAQRLYLDLVEKTVLGLIYRDDPINSLSGGVFRLDWRIDGKDWPSVAHTMIGAQRTQNLRALCEDVIRRNVAGDFIETGVWSGGACILMRAILRAYGVMDRTVWCADSFEGLPPPDAAAYPQDAGHDFSGLAPLAVSADQVRENFQRYDLLDDQVRFLAGWFKDTLARAPIERLAILRLDGDMYQSTFEALEALYPKLSVGGYVIVDDFGAVYACRDAVTDYRRQHDIEDEIVRIDWTGAYWQRSR